MEKFKQSSKQNNPAIDFLVKPLQRLTKYKMLIVPILDKTSPQHPDYVHLQAAFNGFAKAVEKVNDLMDRIMMNKKIQDLDREFST